MQQVGVLSLACINGRLCYQRHALFAWMCYLGIYVAVGCANPNMYAGGGFTTLDSRHFFRIGGCSNLDHGHECKWNILFLLFSIIYHFYSLYLLIPFCTFVFTSLA
jgi:hypothetical protein